MIFRPAKDLKSVNQNLPELAEEFPPTPQDKIDQYLTDLLQNKNAWISVSIEERIELLEDINENLLRISDRWINASMKAKGIPEKSAGEGEEWMILAKAFRTIRLLKRTLQDIKKHGAPKLPNLVSKKKNDQFVAKIFPYNWIDRLLFQKISGKIWLKKGITTEEIFSKQAKINKKENQTGGVCLVLAAGNVSDLSIVDPLYKLFVCNKVIVYKTNPVNSYLGPLLQECYQSLIKKNYLRIAYGGVEESSYLSHHQSVDEIHLTGSDKTYEAIVFGTGKEGRENKLKKQPILKKQFSAELGNITPVIVVPGPWSEKDLKVKALDLVSSLAFNAGFNCLTPRVIVTHKNWELREKFIENISNIFKLLPIRKAYYSGAAKRYKMFLDVFPSASQFGEMTNDKLPWTFITDVNPNDKENICFKEEAFCSLFAETALEAADASDFLNKAVDFANETLWGTLASSLIVHPKSLKDPQISEAVEQAIEKLRYGAIGVNLRTEFPYYLVETPWGAFPGHDQFDIQSGTGKVGNLFMFDEPQKTVCYGPFKMWPNPFVVTCNNYYNFSRKMAYFESSPSIWKLPGVIWNALKG
jgi:acyl-CoA reductase-like NAD-dependent aldehyde dehydrogenase